MLKNNLLTTQSFTGFRKFLCLSVKIIIKETLNKFYGTLPNTEV